MQFNKYFMFLGCLSLGACGDKAATGESVVTMGAALTTLNSSMATVESLKPGAALLTSQQKLQSTKFSPLVALDLDTDWENASAFSDPRACGSSEEGCSTGEHYGDSISIKEYMGIQLDSDAV